MVVHFDRLNKSAGDMRLQSEKCPSEPSTADSDTPPAPNHHPAERMEIVKDMDDPGPGEHLQEMQPVHMPAGNQAEQLLNHEVHAPQRYPLRARKPPNQY